MADPDMSVAAHSMQHDIDADKPETAATMVLSFEPRPKRDLLRQVSMRIYLKGKHVADDLLRNVAPFRLADAEEVCGDAQSSLEHEIRNSKKTRKHLWLPETQDDSISSCVSTKNNESPSVQ